MRYLDSRFVAVEDENFASCHASTLVRRSDGRIVIACFGGTREAANDVDIWVYIRKEDGSFGKPVHIPGVGNTPCWNPVLFREGEELRLWFKSGGVSPQNWYTVYTTSNDGGHTWAPLRELVPGDTSDGRGPVKNKPIRLSNGTLLAGLSREFGSVWKAGVDISHDDGKTWKVVLVPEEPYTPRQLRFMDEFQVKVRGFIQPTLWEYPTGQVHMLVRSSFGRAYRADSADFGEHWTSFYETELPNNNSGLDAVYSEGRLYVVCNPVEKDWGERTPLTLFSSADNGVTFRPECVLEGAPGEFSYPSIIAEDGKLHISYTWQRRNIRYVCLSTK